MNEKLSQLKEKLGEIGDLYGAAAVLGWDQQTYMPRGGAAARGQQMATISKLGHQMFTSAEIGKLLDALLPAAEKLDPDSDDARLVKVTHRHYQKQVKVPAEWVAEFAQVTAAANETWMQARSTDNFSIFQPDLERVLELRRQYSDCFAPYKHVYDPQLDDFEPGMLTEEVQEIFTALRPEQVELIRQISAARQVDDSFLHQPFAEKKQWDFSLKAAQQIGYELGRGRMDKAAHPFCTSFAVDDVRITNRVHPKFLNSSLFGALHETGHALYELGVDHSLERTPLAGGASRRHPRVTVTDVGEPGGEVAAILGVRVSQPAKNLPQAAGQRQPGAVLQRHQQSAALADPGGSR
jgi:carboxypeptidase Taq